MLRNSTVVTKGSTVLYTSAETFWYSRPVCLLNKACRKVHCQDNDCLTCTHRNAIDSLVYLPVFYMIKIRPIMCKVH